MNNHDNNNEEISLNDLVKSSWENNFNDHSIPPRTMRIYLNFLRYFNLALVVLVSLLIIAIFILAVKFMFFHQHEMFIFTDGTDITCIFDPKNGVMTQNDK